MGSKQPKWKTKQKRQRVNDERRRVYQGKTPSPTGIKRVARH